MQTWADEPTDGDQSVEDQGKNPVNTVAKSSSKRKREERDPNVVYLLSDDEENGNATLGAGYNTKKRNKYLEVSTHALGP